MEEKILVVEDDKRIQELIVEFLRSEEYEVDYANDGIEGYEKYSVGKYDLLILDVMMPKLDGYRLSEMIRVKDKNTPIIFLTALGEEEDEIRGFEVEGDDYITKPFSFKVLIMRVQSILRRNKEIKGLGDLLKYKEITLNLKTYKVRNREEEIELTLKEFNILKLLINKYPRVVRREEILQKVWEYEYYNDTRVIDAHVKNLRKKIKENYIKTVKGVGYVLE